jgi:16S rRNA (cytosine967-C5)-methyltransferase
MSVIFNHAQWAVKAVETYRHPEPLSLHLKRFFRRHKFMGSKDRRVIRDMVYGYFRLGRTLRSENKAKDILCSFFVLTGNAEAFSAISIKTEPDKLQIAKDPWKRLKMICPNWHADSLIDFLPQISSLIEIASYRKYILNQPLLFITADKTKLMELKKLVPESKEVKDFPDAIELPNSFYLDSLSPLLRHGLQVQDLSSQWACLKINLKPGDIVWDCCSGSGGKTLSLYRQQPTASFFVSDSRQNILFNLRNRFSEMGLLKYHLALTDLTKEQFAIRFTDTTEKESLINQESFDVILIDAPCSGSGTWGRNPENLPYFKPESLKHLNKMQLMICQNAIPFLKKGGRLYYITCSVFAEENERMVEKIEKTDMRHQWHQYFNGANHNSDFSFISCFVKRDD